MAHYLVRAKAHNLDDLRARLDSGEIRQMRPFGGELHGCLLNARLDADGWATWEEECYCSPPLAMERRAVLDTYFTDLTTAAVEPDTGWSAIDALPRLWS